MRNDTSELIIMGIKCNPKMQYKQIFLVKNIIYSIITSFKNINNLDFILKLL